MVVLKTKHYIKSVRALSKRDRMLLLVHEKFLAEDTFHPKLHTKKLKGFPGSDKAYSFRITRTYRGIFRLSNENIILFAIGHRRDIYQSF